MVAAGVEAAAAGGTEPGPRGEIMRILVPFGFSRAGASLVLAAALVGLSASAAPAEESATQTRFKSPTAAMQALVAAARAGDRAKLLAVLGPDGGSSSPPETTSRTLPTASASPPRPPRAPTSRPSPTAP
jgi:hypothetical protein